MPTRHELAHGAIFDELRNKDEYCLINNGYELNRWTGRTCVAVEFSSFSATVRRFGRSKSSSLSSSSSAAFSVAIAPDGTGETDSVSVGLVCVVDASFCVVDASFGVVDSSFGVVVGDDSTSETSMISLKIK